MSMSNKYDNAMYVPFAKTSLFIHSDFRPLCALVLAFLLTILSFVIKQLFSESAR